MKRSLNLWLVGVVIVSAASWWFGRGLLPDRTSSNLVPLTPTVARGGETRPESIQILVLNGTDTRGLAREYSLLLPRAGCVPAGIGNAPPGDWRSSLLVNRRLAPAQARELAQRLGGIAIVREWDGRGTEDAVLVLGHDHELLGTALTSGGK